MTTIHHRSLDEPGASSPRAPGDGKPGPADPMPPLAPPWPPMTTGIPPRSLPPVTPPPREGASLGRIALWTMLIAVGLLAVVDASGATVSAATYLAVALALTGTALVVGFRYGRARGLIALGSVLAVALGIAAGVEHVVSAGQDVTWRPTTVTQVDGSYRIDLGDATLDLSAVDFTGHSVRVTVHVAMGDLTVLLPSTVDARVLASVDVGDAEVLGQEWSGIGQSEHTVTDLGVDGAGGGEITVHATVDVGNLEVRR